MNSVFHIFTDGSHKGRWGSWAYLIIQDEKILSEGSGRERKTNSNRMEFQATIEALKKTNPGSKITLHTDCRILIENIPLFPQWSANQWKRKNSLPIANADQFSILFNLIQDRAVTWKWVRAHSGNQYNDRCDDLCKWARDPRLRSNLDLDALTITSSRKPDLNPSR